MDASALVKLVVVEPESEALRSWLGTRFERASSVLAAIEVRRAARRAVRGPHVRGAAALARELEVLLASVALLALDDQVVRRAVELEPPALRTLDAIHVATALALPSLEALITYDGRLAAAAESAGLPVHAPAA